MMTLDIIILVLYIIGICICVALGPTEEEIPVLWISVFLVVSLLAYKLFFER